MELEPIGGGETLVPAPPPFPSSPGPLPIALAGLESGIFGGLAMIVWFGADALIGHQHWWAMLNLWAAPFFGNRIFTMGFSRATLVGCALHLFLCGVAGILFGFLLARFRTYLLMVAAAAVAGFAWYYLLQLGLWRNAAPVVARLTPQPATFVAYFLFTTVQTRIPARARSLSALLG